MRDERTIEFIIDDEGNVEAEAHGFKGVGCVETIKKLTRNLGAVPDGSVRRKREFYSAPVDAGKAKVGR